MIHELEHNIFQRTISLIGEEAFLCLKKSTVLVVGIGGVGGTCVESLVRSGISNIIIVDYDSIDISNINRQIIAYNSTIGLKKIDVMHDKLIDINPQAEVCKLDLKLSKENIAILDDFKIDYIVDAIDSFEDKIELIKYAKNRDIKIISAMGAGGKTNPLLFKVADYKDTRYCKLAKKLRKRLRDIGIKDLKVVYSEEEVNLDMSRESFIPSISHVPAVMGYILASELIKDLIHDGS